MKTKEWIFCIKKKILESHDVKTKRYVQGACDNIYYTSCMLHFKVQSSGLKVQSWRHKIQRLGFTLWKRRLKVWSSKLKVSGLLFKFQHL